MKVRYIKTLKDGRKHVLIELGALEKMPVEPISEDSYYRLNYPHDDEILQGHQIVDPQRVYWDTIAQKWVDA